MTTETETERTDVDAAAELAAEPTLFPTAPGDRGILVLPPGWTSEAFDEERDLPAPHRSTGTIRVFDAPSFVAAVQHRAHGEQAVTVYEDEEALALVAILNDDQAAAPGWRDYRVETVLRPTPEWLHWTRMDGKLVDQETFAEHVEDGVNELRSPTAGEMLNIAQTFHATTNAVVKSGVRLADGRVQFRYEEEVDASAGDGGAIAIPDTLTLVIKPFVGGPAYEMTARFRYRLVRGVLTMGYKLDRPHEVKRAAYLGIVETVHADLPDAGHFAGQAPAAP